MGMPGIFCVEGGWSPKLTDTDSVLPTLTLMRGAGRGLPYIHRYVDTRDGLEHLLRRWSQKQYSNYTLGYLGFHGKPGAINLGREWISLEELGALLDGQCEEKTIYFGSCSVLATEDAHLREFIRRTKVRAVAGYTREVDWVESTAFDLLLFDALANYQRLPYAERRLRTTYPDLTTRLGFRMLHRSAG